MLYLDASAIVKLVLPERETMALSSAVVDERRLISSALASVEVFRAVERRSPGSGPAGELLLQGFSLMPIDGAILNDARSVGTPSLRALDAIHVATALRLGRELDALVTYDERMAEAASGCGIEVLSPS